MAGAQRPITPRVFRTPVELYAWFDKNHAARSELWIGFYRKDSGRDCVSYSAALDIALCHGWIDGVRKKVDDITYTNRFTPRRPRSIWSRVNIRRVEALIASGDMRPAGLAAFHARDEAWSALYSFERRRPAEFDRPMLRRFRVEKRAWAFFEAQAPWYQRTVTHWIMSAKKPETRERRFAQLVERCAHQAFVGLVNQGGRRPRPVAAKVNRR
jgi:uncharacterized protein YdeI (YjbR/CyaY-like superfamily)